MTHICVSNLTSIGSDNGLSPGPRQAIIRTSAGILLIRPLGTNFSEFLVEILIFYIQENAFESVVCEEAAILSRPQWVKMALLHGTVHVFGTWQFKWHVTMHFRPWHELSFIFSADQGNNLKHRVYILMSLSKCIFFNMWSHLRNEYYAVGCVHSILHIVCWQIFVYLCAAYLFSARNQVRGRECIGYVNIDVADGGRIEFQLCFH